MTKEVKQTKETTSITLPSQLKRKLESKAQLPEYHNSRGNPSQSLVVQAALERFLDENGISDNSHQTNSTEKAIEVLKARCESLLGGIDQPENELLRELKKIRDIQDTHTKVLKAMIEKEFK